MKIRLLTTLFSILAISAIKAQNPITKHMFTAYPAPLVYHDILFLYSRHDTASVKALNYEMADWHVFSTTDMVNWKDYGAVLSPKTFSWADKGAYAAPSPTGPWTCKGVIENIVTNSTTTQAGITDYKGKTYFFYHNGVLPTGGSYRRSICVDYVFYNRDRTMQKVIQTKKGVDPI